MEKSDCPKHQAYLAGKKETHVQRNDFFRVSCEVPNEFVVVKTQIPAS